MPRDERTFITVHDGMPDHPKIERLSDAAFRLLVSTWCWCSRNRTDGKVPDASWQKRGTARSRRELADAGLTHPSEDGGVIMHDYLQHQRSAAEIAELSEKRRESGRKGGIAKASKTVASAKANAKQVGKQTASKPVAESDNYVTNLSTSQRLSNAPRVILEPGDAAEAVRAFVANSPTHPAETLQARVERQARQLLAEGIPTDRVIAAAGNAARAGWHDLAIQMQRDAARASPDPTTRPSTTDRAFNAALDLADRLDAQPPELPDARHAS